MIPVKNLPAHYRKLRSDEIVRNGDWAFLIWSGRYEKITNVQPYLKAGWRPQDFVYYRRRHVAVKPKTVETKKKIAALEKNPLISFFYPHRDLPIKTWRNVRLIAANKKYFIGLEVSDKNRFKKFLKSEATQLSISEFNKEAV
jgi:hypothetical protein